MINKDLIASSEITVKASPEEVWSVLTKPEKIKEYLFGTEVHTDWKTGSSITFRGEYNGQEYEDKGNVLDVRENEMLKYNYWSGMSGLEDKPENYSVVTYKIEESGNGELKFTWHQQGFSSEEGKCHTEEGLKKMLLQIKEIAER